LFAKEKICMQTYDARIRLAGSLLNEVPKSGLTAPEITVLRRLHGSDAVVEIKPGKHVERDDYAERARLHDLYGPALAGIKNVGTLDAILGPEGVPLAKAVPGIDSLPPPTSGKRATRVKAEVEDAPAEETAELEFN